MAEMTEWQEAYIEKISRMSFADLLDQYQDKEYAYGLWQVSDDEWMADRCKEQLIILKNRLVRALKHVEWEYRNEPGVSALYLARFCPWCQGEEPYHKITCEREIALDEVEY